MTGTSKELACAERRNFLKLVGGGSFTAAMVAGAGGLLWSDAAVAQTAIEEREREQAAEHLMTIATAYVLGASRSYPIMQLDLKENIQNATNGKVYVKLAPGGQLGAGGALTQKVQGGTIQAAQHSLSNFASFAPVVDLINLPYFCGSNQRFTNLVNSEAWKAEVNPKIEILGLQGAVLHRHRSARRRDASGRRGSGADAVRSFRREVPRPGLGDAAAVLPDGRREPDARRLGRDALGDQAGRGGRARSVGGRALRVRVPGYPEPRHLHAGGAGQPGLLAQSGVVRESSRPTFRRASSSPAR